MELATGFRTTSKFQANLLYLTNFEPLTETVWEKPTCIKCLLGGLQELLQFLVQAVGQLAAGQLIT